MGAHNAYMRHWLVNKTYACFLVSFSCALAINCSICAVFCTAENFVSSTCMCAVQTIVKGGDTQELGKDYFEIVLRLVSYKNSKCWLCGVIVACKKI